MALALPMLHRARTPAPSQCEVCRQWGTQALCGDCLARFAAPTPRCRRCGVRTGLVVDSCGNCQPEPPPFDRTVCVADYGFPWDGLVAALKFRGRVDLAGVLAGLLQQAVLAQEAAAPPDAAPKRPALVVPVPLSPSRLAERGYNQAWELARRAARGLGIQARADLLLRPADNAHQATLTRAKRQRNLQQAFMVDPRQRAAVRGLCVAVVDDVMTTGATAAEAARALKRAGAGSVHLWMLARTPD